MSGTDEQLHVGITVLATPAAADDSRNTHPFYQHQLRQTQLFLVTLQRALAVHGIQLQVTPLLYVITDVIS